MTRIQSAGKLRAEERKQRQDKAFDERHRIISLLEQGKSAREAIKIVGSTLTVDGVRKFYKRFQQKGALALLDGRRENSPKATVLTSDVQEIILSFWAKYRAAGPMMIHEKVEEACKNQDPPLNPPSYETVKKFLAERPRQEKLQRKGQIEVFNKQGRSVVRYENTTHSNQRWQVDNTRLDIWIREWREDRWVPCQAHASVAMCAHSRAIAGCWVSKKTPDSWTTALLLRHSILPKEHEGWLVRGKPEILQPDRGSEFMAHDVGVALAKLDIILDPDPPNYPNRKGKIERWFETLDEGCLRGLPGHMKAIGTTQGAAVKNVDKLLTLPDLRRAILDFIVNKYHCRKHSTTNRKPEEHWVSDLRHLREPDSEAELNTLLLKSGVTRKVTNVGISFKVKSEGGDYWAPGISNYWSQDVEVYYNPEDMASLLLHSMDTGKFLLLKSDRCSLRLHAANLY